MNNTKPIPFYLILILGLAALTIYFIEWPTEASYPLFVIVLGLPAALMNISNKKKGHKNTIANIGSYAGVFATVASLLELFL